jgi:hypothetical protein
MSKKGALVETTILTDFLLKRDGSQLAAKHLMDKYSEVLIPHFSWKEMKRGPLAAFVWFHNKLSQTGDFSVTLIALQKISRTPKKYFTATSIQAIHSAFVNLFGQSNLVKGGHGLSGEELNKLISRSLRVETRRIVESAWRKRDELGGGIHHRLICYPDAELRFSKELLDIDPRDCKKGVKCCLHAEILLNDSRVDTIRNAIDRNDNRKELVDRRQTLRAATKHRSSPLNKDDCRKIGDAYFVIFCPPGYDIITTNSRDIEPMARSVGIDVVNPS